MNFVTKNQILKSGIRKNVRSVLFKDIFGKTKWWPATEVIVGDRFYNHCYKEFREGKIALPKGMPLGCNATWSNPTDQDLMIESYDGSNGPSYTLLPKGSSVCVISGGNAHVAAKMLARFPA